MSGEVSADRPGRKGVKAKALENLEAARRLRGLGLLNAAASRLYYSVFQAAVHVLSRRGGSPADVKRGARNWSHGRVENLVPTIRGQSEDGVLFRELRALRERADYDLEPLTKRELDRCWPDVDRFVREATS